MNNKKQIKKKINKNIKAIIKNKKEAHKLTISLQKLFKSQQYNY